MGPIIKQDFNPYPARVVYPISRLTRNLSPMLDQCWANVVDGGPTLVKHWVDVSCLLGYRVGLHSKLNKHTNTLERLVVDAQLIK